MNVEDKEEIIHCPSRAMETIYAIAQRVAPTDLSVLITGESGVGKEVIAQQIYRCSTRRESPFIKINSAALPDELIESELFGYQRGAFTGADTRKIGRIQAAHKGTIFFDEIGELNPESQTKLLQIIQDREFTPLGMNEALQIDIRVLAATNRDLLKAVEEGTFRDDLYHRLNVVHIRIPPLRERIEDIPVLWDYFTQKYSSEFRRKFDGLLTPEQQALMVTYTWPGNVRELENFVKNVVLFRDVKAKFADLKRRLENMTLELDDSPSLLDVSKMVEERVERQVISTVLKQNGWNRKKTAEALQISYRSLLGKIKKLGIQ